MSLDVTVRPATPDDLPAIIALQPRAFGPGRFTRTAYRIRDGQPLISRFCLVAVSGDTLIATVRFTEVAIGGKPGGLLLGPLAVAPEFAGQGFGRRLVAEGLDQAREAGMRLSLLVGDKAYYERFGFKVVPLGQIELPGPADPARILAAELVSGALAEYHGLVTAL
ncbi:MAG: N-acetyltransferase [Hyphomicrobiaceae bacterium]